MLTVIAWLGFLLAAAALAYAWKLSQELDTARQRLDRYNRALYEVNDQVRGLREQLAESTATLHVELMHRTGSPAFTPEMTVRQTHKLHPQAVEVLGRFHLGGCSSCAVEPDETLADVCARSGAPVEEVIDTLNLLLGAQAHGGKANGAGLRPYTPQPVKLPNVAFDL